METLHTDPITAEPPTYGVGDGTAAVPLDLGGRLDAGRAADQRWRRVRQEKLRRGLRLAYRLDSAARAGCVLGGLASAIVAVNVVAVWAQWSDAPWGLGWVAGLLLVGVLTVSGLLAAGSAAFRHRLRKRAQRDAMEIPPEPPLVALASSEGDIAEQEHVRRSNQLQRELNWAYQDERTMGDVCLWAGHTTLFSWGVLLLGLTLGTWVDSGLMSIGALALLPWIGILVMLPFASLACAFRWVRRKLLLRTANQEGLTVRDPGREPWA